MSYPAHLETILRASRIAFACGGTPPSLHEVWRTALVSVLIVRGVEPTEAAIAALATECHRDAVIVFGVLYPSAKAAAEAHGLGQSSVRHRIRRKGETAEQAIAFLLKAKAEKVYVVVFGKSYPHVRAAAKAHGVNSEAVRHRRRVHGETVEQAIAFLVKAKARKGDLVVFGKAYPSISAMAKANGLSQHSLAHRMKNRGQTAEQAVTYLLKIKAGVIVFGKHYVNATVAAKAHGIHPSRVSIRMAAQAETAAQAIAHILRPKASVVVFGKSYPSNKAAAKAHGIPYGSVWKRMKDRGETVEEAITQIMKFKSNFVVVFGKSFPYASAAAKANGVKPHAVNYRMKAYGETAEEAIAFIRANPKTNGVVVFGKSYPHTTGAAKAHGIKPATIVSRMHKQGESAEAAIAHFLKRAEAESPALREAAE